jgi:Lipid II flippase MurJ
VAPGSGERGSGTRFVRRRRESSFRGGQERKLYRGRLPRTLPGIPAPAGLRGARSEAGAALSPAGVAAAADVADAPERVAPATAHGLGAATAYVAMGTLFSRVTGLLRILVAVYALGYSSLSDSFNLANNTPNIVHDLVLGGILTATFVPLFVNRLATRNEAEATESI